MSTFSWFLFIFCCVCALGLALFTAIYTRLKVLKAPLKIRRKRLRMGFYLMLLAFFLIFVVGGVMIHGRNMSELVRFWKETILVRGFICQLILIIGMFLYNYFRKDKTDSELQEEM
jgi:energy-coupling factor transporter transmembrane protein EcfT